MADGHGCARSRQRSGRPRPQRHHARILGYGCGRRRVARARGQYPMSTQTKRVVEYALRYSRNRGLQPSFPRLVHGMMRELEGWPVRNADGGPNIAYFPTAKEAEAAIANARRAFKKTLELK